ncbi:hypothetical protein IWQ62_000615 [Dispira parvispora]|uniref:Vezatin n=1 Tax=Dispira parvispora TaxID=1520584 RepID=A0A9W8E915_9FUNG|nr:hypothetical protein IWQ62_000615 [Dispira parvispora]
MDEDVIYQDSPLAEYLQEVHPEMAVGVPGLETSPTVKRSRWLERLASLPTLLCPGWLGHVVSRRRWTWSKPGAELKSGWSQQVLDSLAASQLLQPTFAAHYYHRHSPLLNVHSSRSPRVSSFLIWLVRHHQFVGWALGALTGLVVLLIPRLSAWKSLGRPGLSAALCRSLSILSGIEIMKHTTRWLERYGAHILVSRLRYLLIHCQKFDLCALKAFKFIQEVELISRGYRLTTPLPPITRIEQTSSIHHCLALRHIIHDAVEHQRFLWEAMVPIANSEQPIEVLKSRPEVDEGLGLMDPVVDEYSLSMLKQTLVELYHIRQHWLHVWVKLASPVEEPNVVSDPDLWVTRYPQLTTLTESLEHDIDRLTTAITRETGGNTQKSTDELTDPSLHLPELLSETNPMHHTIRHHLSDLDQALRSLQASMYLINCHLTTTTAFTDNNYQPLESLYLAVRRDVQQLGHQWDTHIRTLNELAHPPPTLPTNPSLDCTLGDQPLGLTEHSAILEVDSVAMDGHEHPEQPLEVAKVVYEGTAEKNSLPKKAPKLGRAERIALQKEKRKVEDRPQEVKKQERQQKTLLITELQGVLEHKKVVLTDPSSVEQTTI